MRKERWSWQCSYEIGWYEQKLFKFAWRKSSMGWKWMGYRRCNWWMRKERRSVGIKPLIYQGRNNDEICFGVDPSFIGGVLFTKFYTEIIMNSTTEIISIRILPLRLLSYEFLLLRLSSYGFFTIEIIFIWILLLRLLSHEFLLIRLFSYRFLLLRLLLYEFYCWDYSHMNSTTEIILIMNPTTEITFVNESYY